MWNREVFHFSSFPQHSKVAVAPSESMRSHAPGDFSSRRSSASSPLSRSAASSGNVPNRESDSTPQRSIQSRMADSNAGSGESPKAYGRTLPM